MLNDWQDLDDDEEPAEADRVVPPTEEAVADRLRLLRESVDRVFGGSSFEAVWTYIEAV